MVVWRATFVFSTTSIDAFIYGYIIVVAGISSGVLDFSMTVHGTIIDTSLVMQQVTLRRVRKRGLRLQKEIY